MGPRKGDTVLWYRVTRHPRVFHGLTGCQRTPRFWGVTYFFRLIYYTNLFIMIPHLKGIIPNFLSNNFFLNITRNSFTTGTRVDSTPCEALGKENKEAFIIYKFFYPQKIIYNFLINFRTYFNINKTINNYLKLFF